MKTLHNLDNWDGGSMARNGIFDIAGHVLSPTNDITRSVLKGSFLLRQSAGTIGVWTPSILQKWGMSDNWIAATTYSTVDAVYVTGQFFTPWRETTHLDGQLTVGKDKALAFGSTVATAMPYTRVAAFKGLNASQFSSLFKGTFLARLQPGVRGWINRMFNEKIMKKPHSLSIGIASTIHGVTNEKEK